jgi:hypothetical protein
MRRFLTIIEEVTPEEVDSVSALFNRELVNNVSSDKEEDVLTVTLKDNTVIHLHVTKVVDGEEEEDNLGTSITSGDTNTLSLAGAATAGAGPINPRNARTPVGQLSTAFGGLVKKITTKVQQLSTKIR